MTRKKIATSTVRYLTAALLGILLPGKMLAGTEQPNEPYAGTPLPRSTPEAQGLSSAAGVQFVQAVEKIDTLHSFMIVRHGRVIADAWWQPEAPGKPHTLWSLSKSFNSTAADSPSPKAN
jgi:hypothetical protein